MASYSPQTTLKGQPFRPFEERDPAEDRTPIRLLKERPSAAQASRKLLRHWRGAARQTPLRRRPA